MRLGLCLVDHWSSTALIIMFFRAREWGQDSSRELEELTQVLEGSLCGDGVAVIESLGVSRTEGAFGLRFLSSWTQHCWAKAIALIEGRISG